MQPTVLFTAAATEAVYAYYVSGEEQLLAPLLAELRPYLLRYAQAKLELREEAQREDLVQESLVLLLRELRRKKFHGVQVAGGEAAGLLAYARQICRREFLSSLKRTGGKPSEPGTSDDPFRTLAGLRDDEADLLSDLPQAESVLVAATEAVLRLEPKLREPVVQVYFRGQSPQQAADLLGLRLTTLRSRLETGLGQLRRWAGGQPTRPTREVYRALRHLDSGDLFQEAGYEPLRMAG